MTHSQDAQWQWWNIPIKPDDDVPGPHFEHLIPDNEMIDDLLEGLMRTGAAQDYPLPEPEPYVPPPRRFGNHHYSEPHIPPDLESRWRGKDKNMDHPPVPGYRDFPECFAHIDFGGNHAQPIRQTGKTHGRRCA